MKMMVLFRGKLQAKLLETMTKVVINSVKQLMLESRHSDGRVKIHTTNRLDSVIRVKRS